LKERMRLWFILPFALWPLGLCLAQAPPSPICASALDLPPPGTNPAATYIVQPKVIDFGSVLVGGSASGQFCITTSNTALFQASSLDTQTFPILDANQHPTGNYSFTTGLYALVTVLFQPTTTGTFANVVVVTANRVAPVTVSLRGSGVAPLAITTPPTLPTGMIGQLYQQIFSASGGTPSYAWRVNSGLPPGLALSDNKLSGIPTQFGTFSMSITVQDSSTPPLMASLTFTLVIAPAQGQPVILGTNGVVNGASFQPVISQSAWVTILGTSLAPNTRSWTTAELALGKLPLSLDNVSVTINGKNAFVEYISPTQINVVSPADDSVGPVEVRVINNGVVSAPAIAQIATLSPSFFLVAGKYVAAVHADGELVGSPGLIPGGQFRPARSGEILQLYANGLGPTTPAIPSNALTTVVAQITATPTVFFDNVPAEILFAGLVPPYARLYQINARVPLGTKAGDVSVVVTAAGYSSSKNSNCCFITVTDSTQ